MIQINIKNKQAKEIYDRWNKIWNNPDISKEIRFEAFTVMKVIESFVAIYEQNAVLHEEDIQDIFTDWNSMGLVLPEEMKDVVNKLKKRSDELKK